MTLRYLEASSSIIPGGFAIFGAPLDDTGSYRKGSAHMPRAVREASDCLEDYCPIADRLLRDCGFADLGDVTLPEGDSETRLEAIAAKVREIIATGARPLMIGGEHTVSVPAVRVLAERHRDLVVIQFDAHADLRDTYEGSPYSHACVMRRIVDMIGSPNIHQFGIRSGTREEWTWMREHASMRPARVESADVLLSEIGVRPVYITVDLDILDPSVLPGTGTPEPGGLSYLTLDHMLRVFSAANVVGADIVEMAPELDPSGVSAVVAAKVLRTMLMEL